MKIFAFIMAFLVLALSIMPCADIGMSANEGNAKTQIKESNQQKENPQQDDCSPFCQCNCCAGFSVNHFIASIQAVTIYSEPSRTAHLPCELIEISLPIWQPPQLV
ncbi:MAG TPA: DUF6660 family protein [Parafilimonas sp.]|nr:DUF6660 family protein [Parafilimonas sp.]